MTDQKDDYPLNVWDEAYKVQSETGLTPHQLLAQRDELVEALQDILDNASFDCGCDGTYGYDDETKRAVATARAILAKVRSKE